eukprot:scaffold738_cov124-Cylindrotheca_fusiformis.AAC.14
MEFKFWNEPEMLSSKAYPFPFELSSSDFLQQQKYRFTDFQATSSLTLHEEEEKEEEEEDNYDEFFDPVDADNELYSFDIAIRIESRKPRIGWRIKALYDARQSLCFKLIAPEGACMLLEASEVVDSAHILVSDGEFDGGESHFQIEDVEGNVVSASSDQVEAHLAYIVSMESRKRHLKHGIHSSLRNQCHKRQRFHGSFSSTWRRYSEDLGGTT